MTTHPEPPSEGLLPVELVVTPCPEASEHLVSVGIRYWDHWGMKRYDVIDWKEPTRNIASRAHILAAAGVRAEVLGVACGGCGQEPWLPTSRSALQELLNPLQHEHVPKKCFGCDENLQAAVILELRPEVEARRVQKQEEAQRRKQAAAEAATRREAEIELERARDAVRREAILSICTEHTFPQWVDRIFPADAGTVDVEVAVLAVLRFAPSLKPVPHFTSWHTPLTPDWSWIMEIVPRWMAEWDDSVGAGLLDIHPGSNREAFIWHPSFEKLLNSIKDPAQAEQVIEEMEGPFLQSFYPTLVEWTVPEWGGDISMDEFLADRLQPDKMTSERREALATVAARLVAGETLRYLDFLLDKHNLPAVPENHLPRLREIADRISCSRALGEAYSLVWRSVKSAASSAQEHLRAPRVHMTTHAVNQLERRVNEAVLSDNEVGYWREEYQLPLSAMTRLVFFGLFNLDPMRARPVDLLPS